MPFAHGDEDAYLFTARAFAGGPGGWSGENGLFRRVGYPLLISPVFALGQDFTTTYRLVQVVNALLNATVLPLAYLLGRRMLRLDRVPAYVAALAAGTLPAAAYYAEMAMTDVVLASLTLGWLLALYTWLRSPERLSAGLLAGFACGLLYMIHVRANVLVMIQLAVVAFLVFRKKLPKRVAVYSTLAMVALMAANSLLILLLGDKMRLIGRSPDVHTVQALGSGSGLLSFASATVAQLWYLVVVTFGLAAVGWLLSSREVFRRPWREPAYAWTMLIALAATVGIAVGSAATLVGDDTGARYAIYSRYVAMLAPFWLVVGIAALFTATARRSLWLAAGAVGIALTTGALVWARLAYAGSHGQRLIYGAKAAPELAVLTDGWSRMRPFVGTAIAIAAICVIAVAVRFKRLRLPIVVIIAAVNVVTMIEIASLLTRISPTTTPLLADVGVRSSDVVAAEMEMPYVARMHQSHQVNWMFVDRFRDAPPPGISVVLALWDPSSPDDWDGTPYGFHRIGGNLDQHWAVWRRDSP